MFHDIVSTRFAPGSNGLLGCEHIPFVKINVPIRRIAIGISCVRSGLSCPHSLRVGEAMGS
jgi:hypothetical protein